MTKKTRYFDVMVNDRFVCTVPFECCDLFKFDLEGLYAAILAKRPSLKDKRILVIETKQPVMR